MNCHYVTRGITKPWEYGERMLVYFDFSKGAINRKSSKSLFAEEDLNDQKLEAFFKKTIEDPLFELKGLLETGNFNISNWRRYRVAYLYFAVQASRFDTVIKNSLLEDSSVMLRKLMEKGDAYLDPLASQLQQQFVAVAVSMPKAKPLYFPESGFFQFLINSGGLARFSYGYALPTSPTQAICLVPIDADQGWFSKNLGILEWYSIGVSEHQKRVLIPPPLLKINSEQEATIRIQNARNKVLENMILAKRASEIGKEMYRLAGFPL